MPAIMLVDQDETRLQALATSLKTNYLDINPAADGTAAWRSIQTQVPNLVICSAAPPMDDAIALCRRVKLSGKTVPFVAYAPAEDEALRLLFLECGADDFVTVDALTELLRSMDSGAVAAEKAATNTPPTQQQMFFRLRTGELGNVLQFLGFSQRTGRLEISFNCRDAKAKDKANIGIVRGDVVHAEYSGVDGVEAVALLVSRGDAEAYFFDDQELPGNEISLPLSQLLIEATVLSDEITDAQSAFSDLDHFVQVADGTMKADDMDADMTAAFALVDGHSTIKEIFADIGFGELRAKRALKKLKDHGVIRTVTAEEAGVTPRSRAESLSRRLCNRLDKQDGEQQKRMLAHLATLARREASPADFLSVVMLNFPSSLKIVHATCRSECGSQSFMVDGSPVVCSRCGTRMVVRSSANYSLKVDSIAREQSGA